MEIIKYPGRDSWQGLLKRPAMDVSTLFGTVREVMDSVRTRGDEAVKDYEKRFDHVALEDLMVAEREIEEAESLVDNALKEAIRRAKANIEAFHAAQKFEGKRVTTTPGVVCWQKAVAIEKVGLYIPGGTAPLFSTVLMLAVPARIAGCREIVLCTPPNREGKVHHLSELEGGYILLDFYGTGCYPCRQALPELEELLEMYPGKLHVVGINREKKEDWIQYLDEVKPAGLQWNEAHAARNGLFKAYGVLPIPHYVLISPERKVVDSWTGYGEGSLKMRLRKWLK